MKKLYEQYSVLILEQNDEDIEMLQSYLSSSGIRIKVCRRYSRVHSILEKQSIRLILFDVGHSNEETYNAFSNIARDYPMIPMIVIGNSSADHSGFKYIMNGAFDYISKPVTKSHLLNTVKQSFLFKPQKSPSRLTKADTLNHPEFFDHIITRNPQMISLFKHLESIFDSFRPILITGETGTGKADIVSAIHSLNSPRGIKLTFNMVGLDDDACAMLFFRQSDSSQKLVNPDLMSLPEGSTVFLDEIGEMSSISQSLFIRFLQEIESKVDSKIPFRIIASTNKDIWSNNSIRVDLIYRFIHQVYVPPLRDRIDDIPLLVDHFTKLASVELNKHVGSYPYELFSLLRAYNFPGNIRELKAMIYNAISNPRSVETVCLDSFKSYILKRKKQDKTDYNHLVDNGTSIMTFSKDLPTLKQASKILIVEAMQRCSGNQSVASKILGISQQALSKRLKNMHDLSALK